MIELILHEFYDLDMYAIKRQFFYLSVKKYNYFNLYIN